MPLHADAHHGDDVILRDQSLIGAQNAMPSAMTKGMWFDSAIRNDSRFCRLPRRSSCSGSCGIGRADRDQAEHLVDASLCAALGAAGIWDQRAIDRPRPAFDPLKNFLRVAQMRDDLRCAKLDTSMTGNPRSDSGRSSRPWCRYRSSAESSAAVARTDLGDGDLLEG